MQNKIILGILLLLAVINIIVFFQIKSMLSISKSEPRQRRQPQLLAVLPIQFQSAMIHTDFRAPFTRVTRGSLKI